ncbi:competence type IV pilus minor pilin ComGG [Fredinandcohnia sp. QZ13]|uniref:competence type IV pilus minor pilin ComGG n=1 Tax=Fredinandcohnia sp. QZ13 TaxID=3073144 RepID=UPI0028533DD7|nr:competence type IV pilus minor pilin ComGG [Fredinandcohnia sp. QZ13]MDR4888919.1 competence type IV pilus minor pilin ComGG [Fredinandcohnia sp. QZ13]
MKNEKGFILPVTIAISFLFFLVFTSQLNAYLTEKAFSNETEEILILENLMQVGVGDLKATLLNEEVSAGLTGIFNYPTGNISYTVSPLTLTTSQITLTCKTYEQRKSSARFVYDYESKEISSWLDLR